MERYGRIGQDAEWLISKVGLETIDHKLDYKADGLFTENQNACKIVILSNIAGRNFRSSSSTYPS